MSLICVCVNFSIIALTVFIAVGSYMARHTKNKVFKLDIQGHRGCRGLLPENTIPAFLKAVDLGVDTLELDTIISHDSQVVVSHDPFLNEEICKGPSGELIPNHTIAMSDYNLYRMDWEVIKQCDCGSLGNPRFPEQQPMNVHKPLLVDVFDAVESYIAKNNKPRLKYNIETKCKPERDNIFNPPPAEFVKLLYAVLKEKNMLKRITIQSFDIRTLQEFKRVDPSIPLVLLVEHAQKDQPFDFHVRLNELGFLPFAYSPEYKLVTADMVHYIKQSGVKLIPWTANTYDEMVALKEFGVDGIITDYPNIGVQVRDE